MTAQEAYVRTFKNVNEDDYIQMMMEAVQDPSEHMEKIEEEIYKRIEIRIKNDASSLIKNAIK